MMEKINGEELLKHFQVIDGFSPEWKDYGVRSMSFSGRFLRNVEVNQFVPEIMRMLPSDVRLYVIDGVVLHADPDGRDQCSIILASKEWEHVFEGGIIPKMQCIFTNDPSGNFLWDSYLYSPLGGTAAEIKLNKKTHVLEIPKDRETEEYLTIVLRPV